MSARIVSLLACFALSCTSSADATSATTPAATAAALFSPETTTVQIQIDYVPTAAPYTGSASRLDDVWQITADNLARAFQSSPKTVVLPHTLSEMHAVDDVTAKSFTSDALLAIASSHRQAAPAGAASFYVIFVDGYYDDGTTVHDDVLGLSIGTTGVVAMFKPVIATTESTFKGISRYVEQATLVHELGHAFGLVNNGLAMTAAHEDTAHVHHCTNESCTMYWANEGASSAITFAKHVLETGSFVLFGSECLADFDAAGAKP